MGILYTYYVVSAGKATFAVTHLLMVMHLKGTMQYGDRGEVKLNKTPVSPSFCAFKTLFTVTYLFFSI